MRNLYLLLMCIILGTAPALADTVNFQNGEDLAIKAIYAWPDYLLPRTKNLLSEPLEPGNIQSTDVLNDWKDCVFTVEIEWDAGGASLFAPITPRDLLLRKSNKMRNPVDFTGINICQNRGSVIVLHRPSSWRN